MKSLASLASLLALFAAIGAHAAEYPFTKEHKLDTTLHRSVPEMIFVDVDKDRDLDIVARTGNHHGELSWWENKKKGKKWQERKIDTGLPIPFEPGSVAVGDIDGDKRVDLVMVTRYKGVHWLKNKKKGRAWTRGVVDEKASGTKVGLADIDGDDDLDIVLGGKGLFWMENLGKGKKWESPQEMYTSKRSVWDFALTDVDNDGDVDVIFTGESYGREGVYVLSNDDGPWKARLVRAVKPNYILVQDWDDDEDPDVLMVEGRNVSLFLNHEHSGYFAEEPIPFESKNAAEYATLMDVDNDGDRDLVFGTFGANDGLRWYANPVDKDPEGDWEGKYIQAKGLKTTALHPVDLDKDGDEDLFVGWQGAGEWKHYESLLENKGRKKKKKKKKKKKARRKRR